MSDRYASNHEGIPLYVVTRSQWGRTYERLEAAPSLTEAKRKYGWTRELHTHITVRRARESDVARHQEQSR